MVRRASASRKGEMANTPKASNPSSEIEEPQSKGPEPSSERMEQQHENSSPLDKTNSKHRMQEKTAKGSISRKKSKLSVVCMRRSLRIQNSVTPVQTQNIQPVIEEMTVCDSEQEDEQPLLEELVNGPNLEGQLNGPNLEQSNGPNLEEQSNGPTLSEKNMEEKLDYAIDLLETLNSKATKRSIFPESPDMSYKSMYIDSQKKIEALTAENHELHLKLEGALAKLEGYEKGTFAFSEVMDKMKDVILVSSISKATERVLNSSSQLPCDNPSLRDTDQHPKSASKRKKHS